MSIERTGNIILAVCGFVLTAQLLLFGAINLLGSWWVAAAILWSLAAGSGAVTVRFARAGRRVNGSR